MFLSCVIDKIHIISLLSHKHAALIDWLNENGDDCWEYAPSGKWTTGQQVVHLTQSLKPLITALKIPKLVLKIKFGKANRAPRSYDEVVARYNEKLEANKNVVSPFSSKMPEPTLLEKDHWVSLLIKQNEKIKHIIGYKWTQKSLDTCLLPHPILGRMSVSEMLMWTAYHAEHHHKMIIARANAPSPGE